MIDISVQNIVKAFEEGNNILDGISFDIMHGEHVGLLGKNGAGKTTLFRVITGQLSEDEGTVVVAQGQKIGLISQIPEYPSSYTTEDVLKTAFSDLTEMGRRLRQLEKAMETDDSSAVMTEYDLLSQRFLSEGGYDTEYELNRVANGLEIPEKQRKQLFSTLSGGEKTRVNLARLILEKTDILLLDEPTNHLDLKATLWLEDYLSKFKGTVLVISHDRYFLDKTVTRTVEIVGGKAEFYAGAYSYYVEEKQRRYEQKLKEYEKQQNEIRRLQEAADRLHQWGTGNERLMKKSFAIESRIRHMDKVDRPEKERAMKSRFGEKDFYGDEALLIRGLEKSYGGRQLFAIPELLVKGSERIAIIGENGTGKTTFVKILLGLEKPDRGMVRMGPQIKAAYLPQVVEFSHPERSALDTLLYEDHCTTQSARNRLGAFKFSGEDVFKPVDALSGGERSRLKLCMLMKEDLNLLILDEPTNHLDIDSREWIEQAVDEYGGTLLFVSHDRYFINRFATRIWVMENGGITDFRGGYEKYVSSLAMAQIQPAQTEHRAEKEKRERPKRHSAGSNEKKALKLEKEITRLEQVLSGIDAQRQEFATDYEKLMQLDTEEEEITAQIDALMEQWEALS